MTHLMNVYARQAVAFTHGEGACLFDEAGRRYLDALSGIAVNTLGHNHPRLVQALSAQAGRLIHTSNLYRVREQEQVSDKLAACSGMDECRVVMSEIKRPGVATTMSTFWLYSCCFCLS